jgi:hypothetical protein
MAKGQPEPQITQAPTKTPQQTQFLESLLSFFPQAMTGFTIGEAYGGPGQANYSPHTIGEGKGGATPGGGRGRYAGIAGRHIRERGTPLDAALTNPIVEPFRQGQTGNYPKERR